MQEKVSEIYKYAGGLNIEGGFPKHALENNKIWSNIILILDRPLVDNVVFDEILKDMEINKYQILENAIQNINEKQMLAIMLMTIIYYIENASKLVRNAPNYKSVVGYNMCIHVHQDVKNANGLINILKTCLENMNVNTYKANIEWRTDTPDYTTTNRDYRNTDILLSISQCAGLDPKLNAGMMLIADRFIPYDIDSRTIKLNEEYKVNNDMTTRLTDILQSEHNQKSVEYVNNNYVSANKNKEHDKATLINYNDFHTTKILQVNKLWNPKNGNELVTIHFN